MSCWVSIYSGPIPDGFRKNTGFRPESFKFWTLRGPPLICLSPPTYALSVSGCGGGGGAYSMCENYICPKIFSIFDVKK